MSDLRIVIDTGDGACSVLVPAPEMFDAKSRTRLMLKAQGIEFESDEDVLAWVIQKDVPAGKSYHVVDASVLPDRAFRDAWTVTAGKVEVDMPKARTIHRERLRELRAPKLTALDAEYQRADENGDAAEKKRISAQKQALRDVTKRPDIETARTPEELKAITLG